MTDRYEVHIGFELECYVAPEIFNDPNFYAASYHSGEPNAINWKTEQDGSLKREVEIDNEDDEAEIVERGIEFISPIIRSHERLYKVTSDLKGFFPIEENLYNLIIRSDCGCHIHFSIRDKKNDSYLSNDLSLSMLRYIPLAYRKIIANERIAYLLPSFKRQYYRPYSEKVSRENFYIRHERDSEFYRSCYSTIEWRSFNVLGVRTYSDLVLAVDCAYKAIESVVFSDKGTLHEHSFINRKRPKETFNDTVVMNVKALRSNRKNTFNYSLDKNLFECLDGLVKTEYLSYPQLIEKTFRLDKSAIIDVKKLRCFSSFYNNATDDNYWLERWNRIAQRTFSAYYGSENPEVYEYKFTTSYMNSAYSHERTKSLTVLMDNLINKEHNFVTLGCVDDNAISSSF